MPAFVIALLMALFTVSAFGVIIYIFWSFTLLLTKKKQWYLQDSIVADHHMFIMIPMLNEREVVCDTIRSYYEQPNLPRLTLHLVALDDNSDDGTTERLIELKQNYPQLNIVFRHLPNARTGKGHSLNEGLHFIKQYIRQHHIPSEQVTVGIMDADATIAMDDLGKVIRVFEANTQLAMVQINIGMNNTRKWIYALQDLDFISCNYMIQNARNLYQNAAASGNGQFFRLSMVENRGDLWQNSLLEDFESSTRLLLDNLKNAFFADAMVLQEPVNGVRSLIYQRSRWAQGGIQCMGKYGKDIIRSNHISTPAKAEIFFYFLLPFFTAVSCIGHVAAFVYQPIATLVLHRTPHPILLIIIALSLFISMAVGVVYANQSSQKRPFAILLGLTIPLYNLILAPACYIAIFRHFAKKENWTKTHHTNKADPSASTPESASEPDREIA